MRFRIKKFATAFGIMIGFIWLIQLNKIISKTQKLLHRSGIHSDVKYILFWNGFFNQRNWHFEAETSDHKVLEKMGCEETRCVFTSNQNMKPIEDFDAVLFHLFESISFPENRSSKQIYIAGSMESPAFQPGVPASYDNFFNWTSKSHSLLFGILEETFE